MAADGKQDRTELRRTLDQLRPGNLATVNRLDCLARSQLHLQRGRAIARQRQTRFGRSSKIIDALIRRVMLAHDHASIEVEPAVCSESHVVLTQPFAPGSAANWINPMIEFPEATTLITKPSPFHRV